MNNMKQRLTGKILSMLFLLFAIGWTVNSSAQCATFSTQDNGDGNKTLIVTAWGDLTDYTAKVATQKKWNKSAVNNVYSGSVGHEQTVNENQVVDETSATQYYTAEKTYNLLFDGGMPTTEGNYAYNIVTTNKWDPSKWSPKHIYSVYSNNNTWYINAEVGEKSDLMQSWQSKVSYNGVEYAPYIISDDEITTKTFDPSTVTFLKVDDLNKYYNSTTTYTANIGLYRSQNGGTKEALTSGTTYTYESTDKFYSATNVYTKIDNIGEFLSNHSDYYTQNYDTRNFVEIVALNLVSNGCTSIKFVQDESDEHKDDAIKITVDQLNSILNATYNYNGLLVDNSSFVDLSQLSSLETTDLSKLSTSFDKNNASLILPSTINSQDTKTFVDSKGWSFNVYWLSSDKLNLNVEVGNESKLKSVAEAKNGKTNTIVLYPMKGAQYYSASMFRNFDLDGVRNLVLHYLTTVDEKTSKSLVTPNASDFENFSFIKRVILPRGINSNISTFKNTNSSVDVYEICNWLNNNYQTGGKNVLTSTQINVLKPGALAALADAHYTNDDIANGPRIDIFGAVNTADFTFISGIKNKRINLSQMKFEESDESLDTPDERFAAIEKIKNSNIEYLALPNCGGDLSKTLFATLKDNMSQLKGVSYFNNETFSAHTWFDRGGVVILSTMMENVTKSTEGKLHVGIKNINIAGPVNAEDIGGGACVDKNGHLVYKISKTDVSQPKDEVDPLYQKDIESNEKCDGYVRQNGAFTYATIVKADLSDAEIDPSYPNDMCFGALGIYSGLQSIDLPKTAVEIPVGAFANMHSLHSLGIPEGYQYIRGNAFASDDELMNIYTISYDKDGKATIVNNGDSTFTLPGSLLLIETGSFSHVTRIKDVYCLGVKAPQAQRWAFDTEITYGNSGFSPSAAITRSNYMKSGGDKPIAMLHFPNNCEPDEIKHYTDVTREYSITDGMGNTDGNGNIFQWPNQSEFVRAYEQGHTGYIWNAWDNTREPYNNAISTNTTSGKRTNNGYLVVQADGDAMWEENGNPAGMKFYDVSTRTAKTPDYRGWHEFVLTGAYNYKDPDPIQNFGTIKDNNWWTLVVPFRMTKNNLRRVFGNPADKASYEDKDYPIVCELIGVSRDPKSESIVLEFGKDLVQNKAVYDNNGKLTGYDGVPTESDEIIRAGHPYMIRPKMPDAEDEATWTPANHILKLQDDLDFTSPKMNEGGIGKIIKDADETSPTVLATNPDKDNQETDKYYYRFIGSFSQWYLPQYGYFLAWTKKYGLNWYWKKDEAKSVRNWNPYTCVVLVTKNEIRVPGFETSAGVQEVAHWNIGGENEKAFCDEDGFKTQTSEAKSNIPATMIFGESGVVDGITSVKYDFSEADPSSVAPIYNLNGQMINKDGDRTGLPKGIYIQNRTKFVVK